MGRIGDRLATARREKGLSLTDVERAIKVRVKYLEALEDEDHESLPEPAYTRGFLKSYAEFLELDAKELLRQYGVERGGPEAPSLPEPMDHLERDHVRVPRRAWAAVAAVVGVALAIWVAVGLASAMRGSDEGGSTDRSSAATKTAGGAARRPVPKGRTEIVVAPLGDEFPYIEVWVDGRLAFGELLRTRKRFVGRKILVRASEGRQVSVRWDGKSVRIPEDLTGQYEQTFIAR